MKNILVLFLIFISLYFYGNENDVLLTLNKTYIDQNLSDKEDFLITFLNKEYIADEIKYYNFDEYTDIKKVMSAQKNKPSIKKPLKPTLTNKQKAAVTVNVIGVGFLLAGAGLLVTSLVYSDYLDKNEKDYNKYITGKNLSRGLFYGSTAGLGTGGICITVSIPLFFEKKSKDIKNKNIKNKRR